MNVYRFAVYGLLACGCGRIGFGDLPGAPGDGDGGVDDGALAGDGTQLDALLDGTPGFGPSFVQEGNHVALAAASTLSATLAQPIGSGDLLLVMSTVESAAFTGITDSNGDMFQVALASFGWPVSPYATKVWYARTTATAASVSVSVTFTSANPAAGVYIDEYTNVSASPIDMAIFSTGNFGTSITSGTVPLSAIPEVVFGHGEVQGATMMAGPSFTQRATVSSLAVDEDRAITTAGTYDATFNLSSTGEWIAVLVAIH